MGPVEGDFGIQVPEEYKGREQTYIKHRVLQLYIEAWAQKLASIGAYQRQVRIWFVDCFSGPWQNESEALEDTSIHIGLNAIQAAAGFWRSKGCRVELGAIFVEKKKNSFEELEKYLTARKNTDFHKIQIHAFHGEFGDHVGKVESLIGNDPAFLFVDPTGWNGAAMRFIAPLARKPRRDVMVNLMYDYVNRFKDANVEYVREQLKDFFGIEVPSGLDEEGLIRLYREQLKKSCGLNYAADLIVQDPVRDRTYFRLVLAARHEEALLLFRNVEKRVLGNEAPQILSTAREIRRVEKSGQPSLFGPAPLKVDFYEQAQEKAAALLEALLGKVLAARGSVTYGEIRLPFLEECHITETDLKALLWSWKREGRLLVTNIGPGDRSLKPDHVLVKFTPTSRKTHDVIQDSPFFVNSIVTEE